jgi:tetratricopeptide (TPR) repeat protein
MALVLMSCKTSKPEKGLLDGESLEEVEIQPDTFETVPPSLWPAGQRQASAGFYYLVGETMVLNGELEKSVEMLDAAYNLDPNSFLGEKLISTKLQAGKTDGVLADAKRMVLLYPKSADLRLLYGQVLLNKGLSDEAIVEYRKALSLDPLNEEIYLQLVAVYQALKRIEEAERTAKDLTQKVPESLAGWSILSRLLILNGHGREAMEPARRAYEIQSSSPDLTLIYAYALEMNKKTKEAVQLYEKLFHLNPTNQEIIARMIRLYRETGGIKEALELLDEMVESPSGDKPSVHLHRAYLLWELNKFEEASKILVKLAADAPEDDRLRYLAGLGFEKTEKLPSALEMYQGISQESPFKRQATYRAVVVLQSLKKMDDALTLARQLTSAEDSDWESFALESGLQSDQEHFAAAIEVLETGIKKYPDTARLHFLKGVNQEKSGKISDCVVSMKRVIELEPANAAALNYLGYLYAERGENLKEAEILIRRALDAKPGDGYFLDSLGWVLYQKKNYPEALKILTQANQTAPNEAVILEHIGDVYKAQGKDADALKYYKDAASVKAEEKDLIRIREKLKELENAKK